MNKSKGLFLSIKEKKRFDELWKFVKIQAFIKTKRHLRSKFFPFLAFFVIKTKDITFIKNKYGELKNRYKVFPFLSSKETTFIKKID